MSAGAITAGNQGAKNEKAAEDELERVVCVVRGDWQSLGTAVVVARCPSLSPCWPRDRCPASGCQRGQARVVPTGSLSGSTKEKKKWRRLREKLRGNTTDGLQVEIDESRRFKLHARRRRRRRRPPCQTNSNEVGGCRGFVRLRCLCLVTFGGSSPC